MLNLSLRTRVFLFFSALAVAVVGLLVAGLWVVDRRLHANGVSVPASATSGILSALIAGGLLAGLGSVGVIVWVWLLFDQNVARPIERLSGGLRTGTLPAPLEGRYLADLAPAAREAAEARARAAEALAAEVQHRAADLHHDRTMLEAILADIGAGAVMSDPEGRVIFYNAEAARLLPDLAVGRPLGPSIDPAALAEGCQRLEDGPDDEAGMICSLSDGRRIGGRLRRVDGGHVLLLRPRHDRGPDAAIAAPARGISHDFRRVHFDGASGLRLDQMACIVFDTETTGLDAAARIVQIGGVRISRGRLTGEQFDTLVNPGCPIPPAATRVHGITDQMVADAPECCQALRRFAMFAGNEVLVAHNAPFDMSLLRAATPETGHAFANPVLDTVLLSAMVWGATAEHSLDALAARLDISFSFGDRHTAMGDARATAECFLRLIPALQAKGIETVEDARLQARKFRGLIPDANIVGAVRA